MVPSDPNGDSDNMYLRIDTMGTPEHSTDVGMSREQEIPTKTISATLLGAEWGVGCSLGDPLPWTISRVTPGGQGEAAGVRVGDTIEVNGNEVREDTREQLRQQIVAGGSHRIVFRWAS